MNDYYLDWCPRPTHSIDPRAAYERDQILLVDEHNSNKNSVFADFAISSGIELKVLQSYFGHADFAFRTDGIFIFNIHWRAEPPRQIKLNSACLVSDFIKLVLGHVHTFNRDKKSIISSTKVSKISPFFKYPVRLVQPDIEKMVVEASINDEDSPATQTEVSTAQALEEILLDEVRLLELGADYFPPQDSDMLEPPKQMLALLRLRGKYARVYTKCDQWIDAVKSQKLFGVPIYRDPAKYLLIFFLFVASLTVHEMQIQGLSTRNTIDVYLAGLIGFASIVPFVYLIGTLLKGVGNITMKIVEPFLKARLKQEVRFFKLKKKNTPPIMNLLVFVFLIPSPMLFSIQEAPTALDIFKSFKVDWSVEIFEWVESNLNVVSITSMDGGRNFFVELLRNSIAYLPFLLISYYVLDVSTKRRKIIRCLRKLKGHLLFANILNASLDSIFSRSGVHSNGSTPPRYKYYGFNDAIGIVDERMVLEKEKRLHTRIFVSCGLLISTILTLATHWTTVMLFMERII